MLKIQSKISVFFLFWAIFFATIPFSLHSQVYKTTIGSSPLDTSAISRYCNRLVWRMACSGFPFAQVGVDSVKILPGRKSRASIFCSMDTLQRYSVGSVLLAGQGRISPYYIYNVTGVFPGMRYNERIIRQCTQRLRGSSCLKVADSSAVEFHARSADVYMYVGGIHRNMMGASAALAYNEATQRYFLQGYGAIHLLNNLGYGESLQLQWHGLGQNSQILDLEARMPYLLGSRLIPGASINLTKNDSLCLELSAQPYLMAQISPSWQLGLGMDGHRLVPSGQSADIPDTRTLMYGLWMDGKADFGNGGIQCKASAMAGHRRESIHRTMISKTTASIGGQFSLHHPWAYAFRVNGFRIKSDSLLDIHEAFPLGGYDNMCAFQKNEIRATSAITTRNTLILQPATAFAVMVFHEQALYRLCCVGCDISDCPMDFGAGVRLKAGPATVQMLWAWGRDNSAMRPLQSAKTLIITEFEF